MLEFVLALMPVCIFVFDVCVSVGECVTCDVYVCIDVDARVVVCIC